MSKTSATVLAVLSLVFGSGLMIGCSDFWVNPNSAASISVNPTGAALSSTGGGTLQMSASVVLVNGNTSNCSAANWTTSDTTGTILTIDSSSGVITPVGAGQTTVTVTCSGKSSNAIPIDVIAGPIGTGTPTISLNTQNVNPPGSVTATFVTSSGITIPATYVAWQIPSGATLSINGSGATFTFNTSLTTATTVTIQGTVTTNGNATITGTSASINVT